MGVSEFRGRLYACGLIAVQPHSEGAGGALFARRICSACLLGTSAAREGQP